MSEFAPRLASWHREQGRHDLPWQHRGAYATWISEIMLQQTQVAVVIPYFHRFMESFPNPVALADASEDQVLAHWAGLGYYARARNLHHAAQQIRDQFHGEIPDTLEDLMHLKGIGRSTAGAILSLGFHKFGVIQDGNVRRVLARYYGIDSDLSSASAQKQLWELATQLTPSAGDAAAIHAQAMMDLGATICRKNQPACLNCPLQSDCIALKTGRVMEIPRPKKTKQRPEANWVVLQVVDTDGKTLLCRRPSEGIWGGLFAPPIAESLNDIGNAFGIPNVLEAETVGQVEHAFSHFKVQLHFFKLHAPVERVPGDAVWEVISGFQGGLPAPIERVLREG